MQESAEVSRIPTYVRNDNFISSALSLKAKSRHHKHENVETEKISGGSREHYFHFLLGYLLPLIHEQETRQFEFFRTLDCGPLMTPILDKTLSLLGYDFEIVEKPGIGAPVFLKNWDYEWEDRCAAEKTIQKIKTAWSKESCCHEDEHAEQLILVRSQPTNYYITGDAEIKGYGTSRREIVNWREVLDYLKANGVLVSAYEPGSHSLGCQIRTFARAKKIVGMRGAEWANVVWCEKLDALVFDPHPPANTLISLLRRKNVSYQFHYTGQAKCAVDPKLVYGYLSMQSSQVQAAGAVHDKI